MKSGEILIISVCVFLIKDFTLKGAQINLLRLRFVLKIFFIAIYLMLITSSAFAHDEKLLTQASKIGNSEIISIADSHCGNTNPFAESQDVGHCGSCFASHCSLIAEFVFFSKTHDFKIQFAPIELDFRLLNYQYGQFRPPIRS